jgi:hypothetical protein
MLELYLLFFSKLNEVSFVKFEGKQISSELLIKLSKNYNKITLKLDIIWACN